MALNTRSKVGLQDAGGLNSTPPSVSALEDASSQGADVPTTDLMGLITSDLNSLSSEGKSIVSVVVKAMQGIIDNIQVIINNKDQTISKMQCQIDTLESRVSQLEYNIDEVNQYERRDTIIVSGPSLPTESPHENCADVVIRSIKDNLRINITHSDINVAHRLGSKKSQSTTRPLIVKLHSRQMKSEIMNACINLRPNLHVNESVTPKRRSLFKIVWDIRKQHREKFQQCYTQDGKIYVKLKNSNHKQIITSDETLSKFLDRHPILKVQT